jgi:hypothetical protein
MKLTFKDFILTESDDFTKTVDEIINDPYIEREPAKKENGLHKIQKVFDPKKWRKYLQYANAGNN